MPYLQWHKIKVPSSSQKYLKSSQVKKHWRIRLLSHTSACRESCTHTYSTFCLSLFSFLYPPPFFSFEEHPWRSETTDLTAAPETHTHILYAHTKRVSPWRMCEGETLRKAHNSPLPQKSGSERVVVWGGSVMVLMWEAGWVNIPDGRGTDNDEGRTREESQNQGWCSACNKKPEDFHNLLPQDTHTQTQRHAHLSQISE